MDIEDDYMNLQNNKLSNDKMQKMIESLNLKYLTADGIEALDMNFFDDFDK